MKLKYCACIKQVYCIKYMEIFFHSCNHIAKTDKIRKTSLNREMTTPVRSAKLEFLKMCYVRLQHLLRQY